MIASWNWLKELVELGGLSVHEVAERLTLSGVEVERVEELGGEFDQIVVGRVVERIQHPDADKLSVCTVDVGADETLNIVCGAPNARIGLVTVVALVGATVPAGFKIKKSKLRGVKSNGMLCSADELKIGGDHSGIMELDPDSVVGTPIADHLEIRDSVLHIGLTPNRPDCLGMFGLAREIATLFERPMIHGIVTAPPMYGASDDGISVAIEDADGCPRYAGIVIQGVTVAPSPDWIVQRLRAIEQRPVNNIVDVTNLAMFENGQPLHAFDLRAIRGNKIVVRRAKQGETIEGIDHVERELRSDDLVIADSVGPLAIAGVMGGVTSEIQGDTTDIFIECANFDPADVRRTARRLGMHTESSHRFERGVDPNTIPDCLARAVQLILATQEPGNRAKLASAHHDVIARPYSATLITMDLQFPTKILGAEVSDEDCVATLTRLGITCQVDGSVLTATIPSFRPDLERPIDLVEEVGRVIGYTNLPALLPPATVGVRPVRRSDAPIKQHAQTIQDESFLARLQRIRLTSTSLGYSECVNWSIVDPERLDAVRPTGEKRITLKNPLSSDRSVMRTTLLPGILMSTAHNLSNGQTGVRLFEIGRVFPVVDEPSDGGEPLSLSVIQAGTVDLGWMGSRDADGHDLVGAIVAIGEAVRAPLHIKPASNVPEWAHPGVYADVFADDVRVGWVGALHPSVAETYAIATTAYVAEISIDGWFRPTVPINVTTFTRQPRSTRDVALLVDTQLPYARIADAVGDAQVKYLAGARLFDVYSGKGVPDGQKSVALSATYQSDTGTLTDKQIDKAHAKLVDHLCSELSATQR